MPFRVLRCVLQNVYFICENANIGNGRENQYNECCASNRASFGFGFCVVFFIGGISFLVKLLTFVELAGVARQKKNKATPHSYTVIKKQAAEWGEISGRIYEKRFLFLYLVLLYPPVWVSKMGTGVSFFFVRAPLDLDSLILTASVASHFGFCVVLCRRYVVSFWHCTC